MPNAVRYGQLWLFVGVMVSGSISPGSLPYFSPFPHGTGALSVRSTYLALADSPACFPQDFHFSRYSRLTPLQFCHWTAREVRVPNRHTPCWAKRFAITGCSYSPGALRLVLQEQNCNGEDIKEHKTVFVYGTFTLFGRPFQGHSTNEALSKCSPS